MDTRADPHTLIDELPEQEVRAARRFLEYLRLRGADSLRSVLDAAPLDDEPVASDDLDAISEGFEDMRRGDAVSHEEAMRLLREAG